MLLAILGRQPNIGIAELESVIGAEHLSIFSNNLVLINKDSLADYDRFGSVIKFVKILQDLEPQPKNLAQKVADIVIDDLPLQEGVKIKFGLSFYQSKLRPSQINSIGLSVKKILKNNSYSVRVVPNNTQSLSSAQIIHNKLTSPNGIEIVIIEQKNQIIIAKTIHEQNIEAYSARDQARPMRDARVGMLPPKLAQTIINLATGPLSLEPNPKSEIRHTILDPFCGTGVVLQEALIMGFNVYGSDLEARMIEYSQANLDWLKNKYNFDKQQLNLNVGDACQHNWPQPIDIVAGETYLGRPLSSQPRPADLTDIIQGVNTLHKKFLTNIRKQISSGAQLCLAIPAWQTKPGQFEHLPMLHQLKDLGFKRQDFKYTDTNKLIYYREGQIVARELLVLKPI
jgi:tRNA (guanine10-N2)-dimethyltransferase